MLQNCKNATTLVRNACYYGCWAVSPSFKNCFCVAFKMTFVYDFGIQMGSLFEFNFADIARKKRADIDAVKMCIWALVWRGRRQGQGCLALQIMQNGVPIPSHLAPPVGVRRIIRASRPVAGPLATAFLAFANSGMFSCPWLLACWLCIVVNDCFAQVLCWNVCWMAGFWILDVKELSISEAEESCRFGGRSCCVGGSVPQFWHPGAPFWHLGGTLGDPGSSRMDTSASRIDLQRFGDDRRPYFESLSGTES